MTPAEYRNAVRALGVEGPLDVETVHREVDFLKDRALIELGYGEGVKLWPAGHGWYA